MSNNARTAAELLRLYYRALDTQDVEVIEDLFSPDAEWRMPGRSYAGAAAIRQGNEQSLGLGLRTEHRFVHLLEGDGVALAEVLGQSRYGEKEVWMNGMVVVEARDGKITRFCVYPDAGDYATYSAARAAAQS
jgi:ketosteroid isomerase-like protein